jgi:prepilin-type processing-associated H-X9-DG protein
MNEYLGGQEYYNGQGVAPIPKLGNFAPTVYWFCDGGVRVIPTSNPPFDFYFGVMSLGTAGSLSATLNPVPYPWPWNYHDIPAALHIYGHPNYAANFLFVDGHVEPITRTTYQDTLMNSSTKRPLQSFTGAFYP